MRGGVVARRGVAVGFNAGRGLTVARGWARTGNLRVVLLTAPGAFPLGEGVERYPLRETAARAVGVRRLGSRARSVPDSSVREELSRSAGNALRAIARRAVFAKPKLACGTTVQASGPAR